MLTLLTPLHLNRFYPQFQHSGCTVFVRLPSLHQPQSFLISLTIVADIIGITLHAF